MDLARMMAAMGLACAAAVTYGRVVRPRLWRWGASLEEVTGPYPGRVGPRRRAGVTMAVTIDARPDQVWPWLVQLGGDRAGWYSWDHLDNAGRSSAHDVHPEWQDRAVGDRLKYRVSSRRLVYGYAVAILEPNRFLGLHWLSDLRGRILGPEQPRPTAYTEGLWGFLLKELPDRRTRLVIGGYQATRPRWLERFYNYWVYVPVVWIMQARMLSVIKRNVERVARAQNQPLVPTVAT